MKKYPLVTLMAVLALSARAEWQLISDFDHAEPLPEWVFTTQTTPSYEYLVISDPEDESNGTLYVESGSYGVTFGTTWLSMPLAATIEPGTSSTIYFRYIQAGPSNQFLLGTTYKDPPANNELGWSQAVRWADYSSLWVTPEDGLVDLRDGSATLNEATGFAFENNVWYEMWQVVHNTFDGSTSTGTHQLYIKGPNDSEPWVVTVGSDPVRDYGNFRLAPVENDQPQALKYVMIATHSGNPSAPNAGDPWLIDDLYQTAGVVISTPGTDPEPTTWAGFAIDAQGNCDTGDFLGLVNVNAGDWIFVYDLDAFVYLPEANVGADGAWGYVPNY